jgi:hypothetical protein
VRCTRYQQSEHAEDTLRLPIDCGLPHRRVSIDLRQSLVTRRWPRTSKISQVINLDNYKSLLQKLQAHLTVYGVTYWSTEISEWVSQLQFLEHRTSNNHGLREHLLRTRQAFGGMGSLSDIYICREAGYAITGDRQEIRKANDELDRLRSGLFMETCGLLQSLEK